MSKRFLILTALVAVIGGLAVLLVDHYTRSDRFWTEGPEYRRQLTEQEITDAMVKGEEADLTPRPAVAPLKKSRVVRLAIGGLGFADDARNRLIGDLTVTELVGAQGLELVDRQSLDAVIREMQLNLSGLVRAKDAVRIGSLVRADWFLLGGKSASTEGDAIIVRIVDARTGIMIDVAVIKDHGDALRLAQALATFVRQCRQDATSPRPRTFLAIGSFADLSINNRQADFPARLRAGLTAAFQNTQVTLLERDYVNTLLQEVRLDLAGMTDERTNETATMQSAFWMVDGFYQSFETSGFEVELIARVKPLFGRAVTRTLRDRPDEGLVRQVKGFIDDTMAKAGPFARVPTRRREIQTQMAMGHELYKLNYTGPSEVMGIDSYSIDYHEWAGFDSKEIPRRRRNYEEAIRAFETVLLLDPENRQAKIYLAACLRDSIVGRSDEARGLYREVIGSPQRDQWTTNAMLALAWTYQDTDPREAARWFREGGVPQPEGMAQSDDVKSEGVNREALRVGVAQLFERVRSSEQVLKGKSGGLFFGMDDYVKLFRERRGEGISNLVALLPELKEKFPELAPHLLASTVPFQVDTNANDFGEFRRSLQTCIDHSEKVAYPDYYFEILLEMGGPYSWCLEHKQYDLAAQMVEAKRSAALKGFASPLAAKEKVQLAFAYMGAERWQDALNVLEGLGIEPINMFAGGPWGRPMEPFVPSKAVAQCRAKLGLPDVQNAKIFDLGAPRLHIHEPAAFTAEGDTLWLATGVQLIQLDASLKTNANIVLPKDRFTPVTALCVSPERIWVGTAGNGLIEYDKTRGQRRRIEEKDGLLLDEISRLYQQDKTLWIGYGRWDVNGNNSLGGLGLLDLPTGRLTSFTPALSVVRLGVTERRPDAPPRTAVLGIAGGASGEVWVVAADKRIQRYRPADGSWESPALGPLLDPTCLTVGGDRLFVGGPTYRGGGIKIRGGVQSLDLKSGQLRAIGEAEGLPALKVTTLTVVDNDLWVGGEGFVAVVDIAQWKTRKVCYVPSSEVDHIEVAGGFVWVQYGGHLYKAPLKNVQ